MSAVALIRWGVVLAVALALHLVALNLFPRRDAIVKVEGGALQVQLGLNVALQASTAGGQAEPVPEAPREEPEPEPAVEPEALIPTEIEPEPVELEPEPEPVSPVPEPESEPRQEEPELPQDTETLEPSAPTDQAETPSLSEAQAEGDGEAAQDAQSAQTGSRGASHAAEQAGNAASANYAGEVMQYLSQRRRPRASSPGSTFIAFTIAHDGSLERFDIDRSSGSRRFDREALRMIERAAPFPVPPPGVNRDFVVEIEGR